MVDRTKYIPAIVALFVTFVTSIVTIINKYESTQALIIILSVLVGSYVVGIILKWVANTFLIVKVEENVDDVESTEGEDVALDEEEHATVKEEENK